MINFGEIFEAISSGHFKIDEDTLMLKDLKRKGIKEVVFFKKSWIYGLFKAWIVIPVLMIFTGNIYLISVNYENVYLAYGIILLLSINVLYSVYAYFKYLMEYRMTYSKKNYGDTHGLFKAMLYRLMNKKLVNDYQAIENINKVIQVLEKGDKTFSGFFNQAWLNKLIFIVLIIMTGYSLFSGTIQEPYLGILNIFLFMMQLYFIRTLLRNTENLEMDYYIAYNNGNKDGGRFFMKDQIGIKGKGKAIKGEKVKEITDNVRTNFGSFLDYGQLIVKSEGDDNLDKSLALSYIGDIKEITKSVSYMIFDYNEEKLNHGNFVLCELLYNNNLDISNHLIDDKNLVEDNKNDVITVVKHNEDYLKQVYKDGNDEDKREIKEIYKLCGFK